MKAKANAAAPRCRFMPAPFLWMSLSDSAVSAKEQAEAIVGFFPGRGPGVLRSFATQIIHQSGALWIAACAR